MAALLAEAVLTFIFLFIILGATDSRAPQGPTPIAIGLGLTQIHLIGIPITNLSSTPRAAPAPHSSWEGGHSDNSGSSGLPR
jgi:aquaporin Z